MKYLMKQATKIGCNITKLLDTKQELNAPGIRKAAIKKTNIDELKNKVTELEKLLQTEYTQEVMKMLIEAYQQIIEYYSTIGSALFIPYITKMQELLKQHHS